jgi:two-component system sensor histidine kinase AgrC
MYVLIDICTYFLDAVLITRFLGSLMTGRNSESKVYYLVLAAVESTIWLNSYIVGRFNLSNPTLINVVISLFTTFLLTLFFNGALLDKIFAVLSFQIISFISEMLFTIIVKLLDTDFLTGSDQIMVNILMNAGSKIFLLLLVLLVSLKLKKQSFHSVEYNLLLFTTPIVSTVIFLIMALSFTPEKINVPLYTSIVIGILILNIINCILIDRTYQNMTVQNENNDLLRQLKFQKEKYTQLNESYKQSRRIIHDIKKHYFVIKEYAAHDMNEKITEYLESAINSLESTYIKYNTGNLVIDSMLTNYENIASKNGVEFSAKVNVDYNMIPVKEYDLSIIIGNLLDNAINATCLNPSENHVTPAAGRYIKVLLSTENKRFYIACENSVSKPDQDSGSAADNSDHGYGLINVDDMVSKYYGFMSVSSDGPWVVNIIVPIISDSYHKLPKRK